MSAEPRTTPPRTTPPGTAGPQPAGPRIGAPRKRTARDLRTLVIAFAVLALSGAVWLWISSSAAERRARVLAAVPAFPARGQEHLPRPSPGAAATRSPAPPRPSLPPPPEPAGPPRIDPLTSFVLKPAHDVALVHVNALLNTPLFERIKQCLPAQWGQFTDAAAQMGIDLERDVDRLALTAGGMAMSGFFDGKPIARNIASKLPDVEERQYRGHSLWLSRGMGIAQVGNLLLAGPGDSMETLLDRAVDPAPEGADPQDIYGDLFLRSDLSGLRGTSGTTGEPDVTRALLDGLSGVTVRANVWDTVAVSLEGNPQQGRSVADLAAMARGAISLAREHVDPSDVEMATLAELAKVQPATDALKIDLALPMNDIFDRLHFPCPGAQDGGAQDAGAPADRAGSASR